MAQPPPVMQTRIRALALAVCGCLCLAFSLTSMTACEPVDIDDPGKDSATDTTTGTSVLRITNSISEDPDSLTFFLFPGNSTDFSNANKARKVGGVAVNGTGRFTVPAGTWKLAYENSARALTAMRDLDSEEWVKCLFAKDGDYSLILTSEIKNTKWVPSFPTDPVMR